MKIKVEYLEAVSDISTVATSRDDPDGCRDRVRVSDLGAAGGGSKFCTWFSLLSGTAALQKTFHSNFYLNLQISI